MNSTVPSFWFSTFIEKPFASRLSGVTFDSNLTASAAVGARHRSPRSVAARNANRVMEMLLWVVFMQE